MTSAFPAHGDAAAARVARRLFQALPIGLLDWRRADLTATPPGIVPHWFATQSEAAAARADFIAVTLAADADLGAAAASALAQLSAPGVLYLARSWPGTGPAPGALQDGLRQLAAALPDCALLACELQDPHGHQRLPAWLAYRDGATMNAWRQHLRRWDGAARILMQEPGAPAPRADTDGPFDALCTELARWEQEGRECPFWWRDDDLIADEPALRRIAALSLRYRAPVLMAVIPAQLDAGLAAATACAEMATLAFCQHGWNHVNHEPVGQPKSEFGPGRPHADAELDIANGAARLRAQFGARFVPVFVPPWNTVTPELVQRLPAFGLHGVSQYFGQDKISAPGVQRIDTQVDVIGWGANAGVRDPVVLVERIIDILELRRVGRLQEPVGILSHHRVMAEGTWDFMEQLLAVLERFRCVRWHDPRTLFAPNGAASCAA